MTTNDRGQALLESVMALPFLIAVVGSILLGLYQFSSHYLLDYRTYQAALCLSSEVPIVKCKEKLRQELALIPLKNKEITLFYRREREVRVRVEVNKLLSDVEVFEETLSLPLLSKHFEAAQ